LQYSFNYNNVKTFNINLFKGFDLLSIYEINSL